MRVNDKTLAKLNKYDALYHKVSVIKTEKQDDYEGKLFLKK